MVDRGEIIGNLLKREGLITQIQYDSIMYYIKRFGGRFELIAIEQGYIDEITLLKFLSQKFKFNYITTEDLSRLKVDKKVLNLVPIKIAEEYLVFPIFFDQSKGSLEIVTPLFYGDSIDTALKLLKRKGIIKEINILIGRYDAVEAAINKWYKGDIKAFTKLLTKSESLDYISQGPDSFEKNIVEFEEYREKEDEEFDNAKTVVAQVEGKKVGLPLDSQKLKLEEESLPYNDFFEFLNIIIGLLENNRGELKAHSILVAKYTEDLLNKFNLSLKEYNGIKLAAFIHDIGKWGPYHLTPFNVAYWDLHRTEATKRYLAPLKLLESVKLLDTTSESLRHLYEKYDGTGFPAKLKGEEIPLGSRLLAIVETYIDLVYNPKNPYKRKLTPKEALSVLYKASGTIFDPKLVEILHMVISEELLKQRIISGNRKILLVDTGIEELSSLEFKLGTYGYIVEHSNDAQNAFEMIIKNKPDIVISEVDLSPYDGYELLTKLRERGVLRNLIFIYLSSRSSPEDVDKGLRLGADDYILKPPSISLLVAKINRLIETKKHKEMESSVERSGVSGSLKDMALPDLIQILTQTKKTGRLSLNFEGGKSGEVHFREGNIVNAIYGDLQGEEAFFSILMHEQGNFFFDSNFVPKDVVISMDSETLLLEGLRIMDEKKAGLL